MALGKSIREEDARRSAAHIAGDASGTRCVWPFRDEAGLRRLVGPSRSCAKVPGDWGGMVGSEGRQPDPNARSRRVQTISLANYYIAI